MVKHKSAHFLSMLSNMTWGVHVYDLNDDVGCSINSMERAYAYVLEHDVYMDMVMMTWQKIYFMGYV